MSAFVQGFASELTKLAKDDSPSVLAGIPVGAGLGAVGGVTALAHNPHTEALAKLRKHIGGKETAGLLESIKGFIPAGLTEAVEELKGSKGLRRTHLVAPAVAGAGAAALVQLARKAFHSGREKKAGERARKFIDSPTGAMFAEHLPLGPEALGAMRAPKGQRLKGVFKGMGGSILGNAAGATAGLVVGKAINHLVMGGRAPAWMEPTLIAAGGTALAPMVMHMMTRRA